MLKSIVVGIIALLAATFGLHNATIATAHATRSPYANTAAAQVAATAAATIATPATTTPSFQGLPSPAQTTPSQPAQPWTNPVLPATQGALVLDPLGQYVTQSDLASATVALNARFSSEIDALDTPVAQFPEQVAGDGTANPFVAGSGSTDNLTNLTASDIPNLSGSYLSLSGGAVTGTSTFPAIGIGTTSPGSVFSVAGVGNWTNATSTYYSTGGINLAGGCFAVNGTCVGGGGGSVSTGTQGQFAFYNASGTTISGTSTLFAALNGNIGIGTTTPPQPLSVIGNGYVSGLLGIGTANPATNLDGSYGVEIEGNGATSYSDTAFRNSANGGNITLSHERGTQSSPLPVNTGDNAGAIYFQVLDPLTSQLQEVGGITSTYNGNDGSVRDDGALTFQVNSSADTVMGIYTDTNDETRFGFGTAAPAAMFDFQTEAIAASGNTYGMRLQQRLDATSSNVSLNALYINPTFNNNSQTNVAHNGLIVTSGNVGIDTVNPYSPLQVTGPNTASTSAFAVVNSASTTVFSVFDDGNSTYSGSIFQSSDQRLKTAVQSLDASSSLSAIEALNPVSYFRIDQPDVGENLGFIAQQVQQIFPQLVSTTSPTTLTPNGTLTLNYTGLISPIVSAVQAISNEIASIETTIAGFAQSFTTHILTGDNVTANNELCVGSTCITPAQFEAMVAAAGQTGATSGQGSDSSDASATSTPDTLPVIQVNGDNPAIVQVGATYSDLGATITGPQADLNLGVATFVNGVAMNPVQIDTSTAATDTIDYVSTDQNGLAATSTRTVIVEGATSTP